MTRRRTPDEAAEDLYNFLIEHPGGRLGRIDGYNFMSGFPGEKGEKSGRYDDEEYRGSGIRFVSDVLAVAYWILVNPGWVNENKAEYLDALRGSALDRSQIEINGRNLINCAWFVWSVLRNHCADAALSNLYDLAVQCFCDYADGTETAETSESIESELLYNPTSPTLDLIHEILASGGDLEALRARKEKVSKGITYDVKERGKERLVRKTSYRGTYTVQVTDIDKISGSNKGLKKILTFTLSTAAKQSGYNSRYTHHAARFTLQEMVDCGIYGSIESARLKLKSSIEALSCLKAKASMKRKSGKKVTDRKEGFRVLFTGLDIDNNDCAVYLNPDMDWGVIMAFYALVPDYYYRLPNRAAALLEYVFRLARRNADKIERDGFFTVSFRALETPLWLPAVEKTKNTKRDIRQPIETAIEQIRAENEKTSLRSQFDLSPIVPEAETGKRVTIKRYLDEGKLKVSFAGDLAERFAEISEARREGQRYIDGGE